jgi:hypothetical protein
MEAGRRLRQQARFDAFVRRFDHERSHQAIDMATPAGGNAQSPRRSNGGQKKPVLDNDTPLASEDDPIYKESWTISTLHGPTEPSKKS